MKLAAKYLLHRQEPCYPLLSVAEVTKLAVLLPSSVRADRGSCQRDTPEGNTD